MKHTNVARRRSKTNPTHYCMVKGCNVRIFNRERNAKYCKKCGKVIEWLHGRISNLNYSIKRYKGYKVKIKYRIYFIKVLKNGTK